MFTQLTTGNVNKYFLVTMRVEGESELTQCAQLISRSLIVIYTVCSDDWFEYIILIINT